MPLSLLSAPFFPPQFISLFNSAWHERMIGLRACPFAIENGERDSFLFARAIEAG
jgi:hypothetical protein